MRDRGYGRIVFTSSASGIYGNFGQANYGAAKAAMIGLMNVLHLEGAKYDIRVNVLAPTAATGMTAGLLPPEIAALLTPELVTPAVLFLVGENAPSRTIMGAGGGVFAVTHIEETAGRLPAGSRTDAGKDRRVLRGNRRSRERRSARERIRADIQIRRSRQGHGRRPSPIGAFHARSRHRLHSANPDRQSLSRRLQRYAGADARRPRDRGRARPRRHTRGRGRRRDHGRRLAAGLDRLQRRAAMRVARRAADQRSGNVGRSPMRVRPDGDLGRRQGDHLGRHEHHCRRRPRVRSRWCRTTI